MFKLLSYAALALDRQRWSAALADLKLVAALMGDERVPLHLKALPGLGFAYIFSPIDLVPSFIPFLGQIDDLAVLMLSVQAFKRLVPAEILAEHQAKLAAGAGPQLEGGQ